MSSSKTRDLHRSHEMRIEDRLLIRAPAFVFQAAICVGLQQYGIGTRSRSGIEARRQKSIHW